MMKTVDDQYKILTNQWLQSCQYYWDSPEIETLFFYEDELYMFDNKFNNLKLTYFHYNGQSNSL